ncbi:hypothetical protein [Kitasatospora sp. NPDC085464]|uniref:hypothetical protein n=1 Tax=Kitasatospora sp. NPDC085464 TaxID=3364063 RepID=UPI0037C80A01
MTDVFEALAIEGGQQLVRALATGVVDLVRRAPALWRRSGRDAEQRIGAELERSSAEIAAEFAAEGEDGPGRVRARAEVVWETRLRDLLAAHPEALQDVEQFLAELRSQEQFQPQSQTIQNITASGQNAQAQGVIGGNIVNLGVVRDGGARGDGSPNRP